MVENNKVWFEYLFNETHPTESTYRCRLCSEYYDEFNFNSHSSIVELQEIHGFNNMKTHKLLYNTYVRSILEYGSIIWNPYYHIYTNTIENVQRKFTRILCYKFGVPRDTYEIRLLNLNMKSLFSRRLYFDEFFLYKCISMKLNTELTQAFNINIPLRST